MTLSIVTGSQIFTVCLLVVGLVALVWVAVEFLLGQERRHAEWRADIDQAIDMVRERHPSTPAEDRPDWPPTPNPRPSEEPTP